MVQKKHTNTLDFVSIRNTIDQLKEHAISLGLAKSNISRIEDALLVIEIMEKRKPNAKQKA